jgi:N-methylhydantoinase B
MNIVLAEVLNQLLLATAEEMGIALKKTAFSPNIKERADSSTAIFDAQGRVIVQAAHIPIHLSSMLGLLDRLAALGHAGELEAGDMFLANDPFACGGSHLNDIAVAMPVFAEDRIVAFVANIAHHSDVGGRIPGSQAQDNTEIFQDGLRLPLLQIMRRGHLRKDVMELLQLNSRTPEERQGDFNAQFAANILGARKVSGLYRKFGAADFEEGIRVLLDSTEQRTRNEIRKLPRGRWRARRLLDDDGAGGPPVPIEAWIEVLDGEVLFDFANTGPQVLSSINATRMSLLAAIYYVMRAVLDPTLPTNAGFYRPFRVEVPLGSVLNARPPASVAARFRPVQAAVEAILGAIAPLLPHRVVAGSGTFWNVILSGQDAATAAPFVDYEAFVGGGGGKSGMDGWNATWSHCSNSSNLPIEVLEAEYPLRIRRYELRPDSGGPGKSRGGLGCIREIETAGVTARFSLTGDGYRIPPNGLFGGEPGALAAAYLLQGRRRKALASGLSNGTLAPGEILQLLTPGGAGYGEPLERDVQAVLEDTQSGRISVRHAQRRYGVVVRDGRVDMLKTEATRKRLTRSAQINMKDEVRQ